MFTWKPCFNAMRAVLSMAATGLRTSPVLVGRSVYGSRSHAPCEPNAPSICCLIDRTVTMPLAKPIVRYLSNFASSVESDSKRTMT